MSSWSDSLLDDLDRRASVVETGVGQVQVARDGSGPQVLVIHGGPGGFDQGLAYGRHLRDGGCELIAPSRPGYLRTPLSSGRTPMEQADLYAALLDALEIDRVAVLGYSSGGTSSVHFAARHPDRVSALLLDSAVLQRYEMSMNVVERFMVFSNFGSRLWPEVGQRWPVTAAKVFVDGLSTDLDKHQKQAAVDWITGDQARLDSVQEMRISFSLWAHRRSGLQNDEENEAELAPLPFGEVACPTMITHGLNDGAVSVEHSKQASKQIDRAQLMLVDEGHHFLPVCRHFEAIRAERLAFARDAG
jgi:pimeloyl-ACP methyl ester carboxylesterase